MNGHKITMHAWMVLCHQRNDLFFVNVGYLIAEYEPNTINTPKQSGSASFKYWIIQSSD